MLYIEEEKEGVRTMENPTGTVGRIVELMMDRDTNEFSIEHRVTISDFFQRYSRDHHSFNSIYFYDFKNSSFFLTDNMELLYVNPTDNIVMYDDIKCQNEVENKLGKHEEDKQKFKTIKDFRIVLKNGGFIFYSEQEIYFLGINSETKTVKPLIKIDFELKKEQLSVWTVCPCPDPNLIVFSFRKDLHYILLVWNVEENREVYNFSTSEDWSFIYGPGSKAGFILNQETYVNLDTGLINNFFQYKFSDDKYFKNTCGYKINETHD